jgi:hypothetical protein
MTAMYQAYMRIMRMTKTQKMELCSGLCYIFSGAEMASILRAFFITILEAATRDSLAFITSSFSPIMRFSL